MSIPKNCRVSRRLCCVSAVSGIVNFRVSQIYTQHCYHSLQPYPILKAVLNWCLIDKRNWLPYLISSLSFFGTLFVPNRSRYCAMSSGAEPAMSCFTSPLKNSTVFFTNRYEIFITVCHSPNAELFLSGLRKLSNRKSMLTVGSSCRRIRRLERSWRRDQFGRSDPV